MICSFPGSPHQARFLPWLTAATAKRRVSDWRPTTAVPITKWRLPERRAAVRELPDRGPVELGKQQLLRELLLLDTVGQLWHGHRRLQHVGQHSCHGGLVENRFLRLASTPTLISALTLS